MAASDPGGPRGAGGTKVPPPGPLDELHDAPPFLTWRAIYVILLTALAADIALAAVVGAHYG